MRKAPPRITQPRWFHGLISLLVVALLMLYSVLRLDAGPQLPLLLGCVAAGLAAFFLGFRWEALLESMLRGVGQALEAIFILLLIGCLVGVWVASGTVPAMIFYGLKLLSARYFFCAAMVICGIVSFAIGAWGTVGTVGIALMGIGTALNLPPAPVAACVVSGAYFGDAVSPLSDATNLTAAVVGESCFSVIRRRLPPILLAFALAALGYFLLGLRYGAPAEDAKAAVAPLLRSLETSFSLSPLALLPLLAMLACILARAPAIPSMLAGVFSGALVALLLQRCPVALLFTVCVEGYASESGQALLDQLLSVGGLRSMLDTISIILLAMAFGGIMQSSGQMSALDAPLAKRLGRFAGLNALTSLACVGMNLLLPDQYLSIAVPGQMLAEEYDRRGHSRSLLALGLTAGAASSPLVPWNTCGIYCRSLLGVSALQYLPFSFFNLLALLLVLLYGFVAAKSNKQDP